MKISAKKLSVLAALTTKKGRRKYSSFIASGIRVVEEAVKSSLHIQYAAVAQSELTAPGRLFLEKLKGINILETPAKTLRQIDRAESTQGIVAVISIPRPPGTEILPDSGAILALDGISDPSNLGAIARSALAFGFDSILMSRDCAELYSPKVIRASAGAIFHLNPVTEVDLTETLPRLKSQQYLIVGADTDGGDLRRISGATVRLSLVIGNEARGISPPVTSLCDELVRIPTAGRCESLSAPVAAGIIMYEISKRGIIASNR
jgi:TrmH family RNA methyltransferase